MRTTTYSLVFSLASLLWFGAGFRVVAEEPAAESAGQRWAVMIGVNEYLDPAIPNLKYCVSDAYRVFEALTENGGFEADRVLLITDDQQKFAMSKWARYGRRLAPRLLTVSSTRLAFRVLYRSQSPKCFHFLW